MKAQLHFILKKAALTTYFFGVIFLIAGVILAAIHYPARAAEPVQVASKGTILQQEDACSVPSDWNQTVRLFYERQVTQEWTFDVEEAAMDVVLEFFYYQDRDPEGCPFDCSTGACQLDEIGVGSSPLGEFSIEDGSEGANQGVIEQGGRLAQGSYVASFSVTGQGSINIGFRVHKKAVTPPTPEDTATPTPTQEIATPTEVIRLAHGHEHFHGEPTPTDCGSRSPATPSSPETPPE
jgi:hypothetical protein